jgi:hypothetical protein
MLQLCFILNFTGHGNKMLSKIFTGGIRVWVNQRTHFPLTPTYFPCRFPLPPRASRRGVGGQAVETESMLALAASGYINLP